MINYPTKINIMYNKFILNIITDKDFLDEKNSVILNKEFFIILLIALINIIGEFFVRYFLCKDLSLISLQAFHIVIFFLFPVYLIFHSFRKSFILSTILSFLIIPLYFLIEKQIISFYFAALFSFSWIFYYLFFKNDKKYLKKIGLGFKSFKTNFILGIILGIIFCIHIYYVLFLSGNLLMQKFIFSEVFVKFFLEISFSLLGMEVFFRYLLFKRLIENYNFSFLAASTISTVLFLGPFLTNPSFINNSALFVGTIYYVALQGYISCYLVRKTKSILPSFFSNLIISLFISTIIF